MRARAAGETRRLLPAALRRKRPPLVRELPACTFGLACALLACALGVLACNGAAPPPVSRPAPLVIPPLTTPPPASKNAAPATVEAPLEQRDRARAAELFNAGRAAAAVGDLSRARERFAESQRFEPAVETLLDLASVEARMGEYASARAHYQEAYEAATALGQTDRANFAKAARDAIPP